MHLQRHTSLWWTEWTLSYNFSPTSPIIRTLQSAMEAEKRVIISLLDIGISPLHPAMMWAPACPLVKYLGPNWIILRRLLSSCYPPPPHPQQPRVQPSSLVQTVEQNCGADTDHFAGKLLELEFWLQMILLSIAYCNLDKLSGAAANTLQYKISNFTLRQTDTFHQIRAY